MQPDLQEVYRNDYAEFLTLDELDREPFVRPMYDIIDGHRIYHPWATRRHHEVRGNLALAFDSRLGYLSFVPCDLLICRDPLRTRRPDLFLASYERLGKLGKFDPLPMGTVPELIAEVLDLEQDFSELLDRIKDYASIGVDELWIVNCSVQTIDAYEREGADAWVRADRYAQGDTITSRSFPTMAIHLSTVFQDD